MVQKHFISRTLQIGACGAAILLSATPGSSEPDRAKSKGAAGGGAAAACMTSYKSALEREQAGRLREAKDLLLSCAKATCGVFLKQECSTRYSQLNSDIPSVVPLLTDDARVDIQVKMDGDVLTSRLDGRALPVDPGVHEFTFATDRGVFATQKVIVVQGQRSRPIAVAMHSRGQKSTLAASVTLPAPVESSPVLEPRATPEPAPEKPAPRQAAPVPAPEPESVSMEAAPTAVRVKGSGPGAVPYIVGGAGVLAIGAGALLTVWGRKDNDALAACSPNCPLSSPDRVRTLYTAADISIGAGLAAVGVATFLFATSGSKEKAPARSAYGLDVHPTPSGAFASVAGSF